MAIFRGNFSIAFSFDSRSNLILDWARKTCFKRVFATCQSSGPIRYVPGSYSKREKDSNLTSGSNCKEQPSKINLKLKLHKNMIPVNDDFLREQESDGGAFLDNEISMSRNFEIKMNINSKKLEPDSEIHDNVFEGMHEIKLTDDFLKKRNHVDVGYMEEMEWSEDEMEVSDGSTSSKEEMVPPISLRQDAENYAIGALASRAHSVAELKKKLCRKKFPVAIVDSVVADLQDRGLLCDNLFSESFARSRWLSNTWGPNRIKLALGSKGVTDDASNKALKQVFEEDDSHDKESWCGMSKSSLDSLIERASKQWLRSVDAPDEKRKMRIIRWLQYRGFNWGVVSFVLKKLESRYPCNG